MKLLYLTNIQIPAKGAQNLQIQAMSRAFNLVLGKDFLLISPQNKENKFLDTDFNWIKIKISKSLPRFLKQSILIFKALQRVFKFKPNYIFTRDIAVACTYKIFGFQTIYEVHRPFQTMIGDFLFKVISKKNKNCSNLAST